jgi:hypothetical protein
VIVDSSGVNRVLAGHDRSDSGPHQPGSASTPKVIRATPYSRLQGPAPLPATRMSPLLLPHHSVATGPVTG